MFNKWLVSLIVFISFTSCLTIDLNHTEIYTVTETTRFTALNPDVKLVPFEKVHHVKGNFIFTIGDRIKGDKLILTYLDKTQFGKAEDIEVFINYPEKGRNGMRITQCLIYVDLTSEDADAFLTDGGPDYTYADILLACNQTKSYTYELFLYGY